MKKFKTLIIKTIKYVVENFYINNRLFSYLFCNIAVGRQKDNFHKEQE